jgi:hypothetical protein
MYTSPSSFPPAVELTGLPRGGPVMFSVSISQTSQNRHCPFRETFVRQARPVPSLVANDNHLRVRPQRSAKVGRLGLEPSTLGLKVPCSTR